MFSVISTIPKLIDAFASGDGADNFIGKLIEDKIDDLGKDLLMSLLPIDKSVTGGLSRATRALDTGGVSELNRLRSQWLSSVTPAPIPGSGFLNRVQNAFQKNLHMLSRPEGKWQRWDRSRQMWLDEKYKHDWRTQRRDTHGRWTFGRTRYPYVPKDKRRLRAQRRRAARKMARQIIQAMNRHGS